MLAAQLWAADIGAVNEVLKLQKAGIPEDVILAYIRNHPVNYALSADDLISLKSQGLTSDELNAMLEASSAARAATPAPEPAPATAPAPAPAANPNVLSPATPVASTPVAAPATVVTAPAPATVVVTPSPQTVYFYQELTPYGRWIMGDDGQWYWQPTVVMTTPTWRPYWDNGYWVNTDVGWYWASDYPWGAVTFHYGRWHMHPRHGWIWMPGREWGPAWVVWRGGDTYCGWAPLPPHARFDVYSGRYYYHDRIVAANFEFGLSFGHFNFCYMREMGERHRMRFYREHEVRTIYNHTTIINNYTVINRPGRHDHCVVNRGIDPGRISDHGGKPPERIRIDDRPGNPGKPDSDRIDHRNKTLAVYRPEVPEIRNPGRGSGGGGVNNPRLPGGNSGGGSPNNPVVNNPSKEMRQPVLGQSGGGGRVSTPTTPQAAPSGRNFPMTSHPSSTVATPPPAASAPVRNAAPIGGMSPNRSTVQPRTTMSTTPMPARSAVPNVSTPAYQPSRPRVTTAPMPAAPQSRPMAVSPSASQPISRPSSVTTPGRSIQPATRMGPGDSSPSRGSSERRGSEGGRR